VSSAHGPLRHLLLCFPEEASRLRGYRTAYADLFAKLPATTRLTVLTHPAAAAALEALLGTAGCDGRARIVAAPADLEFTEWAQDPYLVVSYPASGPALVRPAVFGRKRDGDIADLLARTTTIRTRQTPLWFEGGCVLVGDDFILVDRGCLDATLKTLEEAGTPIPADRERTEYGAELFADALDPTRKVLFVGSDLPVLSETRRAITVKGREVLEILPGGATGTHPHRTPA
jgi:hypothetical protein